MSDTATAPTTGDLAVDGDVSHWVCCQDRRLTLCGIRYDEGTDFEDATPDCVVCNDLDWSDTCPLYGHDGCRGSA